MAAHTENPPAHDVVADRRGDRRTRLAVESWENEGGHLSPQRSVSITPIDVSPVASRTTGGDLAAMRTKFLADFASGSMGRHHNTYQHRARLLRQMTGEHS